MPHVSLSYIDINDKGVVERKSALQSCKNKLVCDRINGIRLVDRQLSVTAYCSYVHQLLNMPSCVSSSRIKVQSTCSYMETRTDLVAVADRSQEPVLRCGSPQ